MTAGAPAADLSFDTHLPSYATHALHPFAAKFPPQLARWMVEEFSRPGETVLDPFAGSGTMLVEARLLGRNALAADIDPLARLIARVKSTPVDPARIEAEKRCLDARLDRLIADGVEPELPDFPNRDYWFRPVVQRDLALLRDALAGVSARDVRDFLLVVYSSVIIAKGPSTVANALDIAHSRAHHVERVAVPAVRARFDDRYRRALRAMSRFYEEARCFNTADVVGCDARALPIRDASVSAALTSPPYVTAIEYPRSHKFSVWWIGELLGVSNRVYEHIRGDYVGTENVTRAERQAEAQRPFGLQLIDDTVAALTQVDPISAGRARRYFRDMERALREMLRTLQPGRYAVLVVGDSTLRGVRIPTAACLAALAASITLDGTSFVHERTLHRSIRERNRQMPIKRGRNGDGITTEDILVLQRR
jgi:tRNA G10  N-methylase Trm11